MPFVADEIVTAAKLNMATIINYGENQDSRTFTNTGFLDLDVLTGGAGTVGAVIVPVSTGVAAKVTMTARLANTGIGGITFLGVRVSGATTVVANDGHALMFESGAAADIFQGSFTYVIEGLSTGVNTFELQARCTAGTSTLARPYLIVEGIV